MNHLQNFLSQGYSTVTDPETGRIYPIPAGGVEDGTEEEVDSSEEEIDDDDEDDDDDDDNFNGETFLQSIEDEALRNQLEPHVKRWDAGVTRRFQELHSQLKPYQELGAYESLSEAQQLYQILNERPQDLYQALAQALGSNVQQGQPGPQSQTPPQQQGQNGGLTQQQYAQLPPELQRQFDQNTKIVNTLAEAYVAQEKAQQQAREDEELDKYLSSLKTEFGDFDEHYVLSKMSTGIDGAKAVKEWNKAVRKAAAKSNSSAAPRGILSGGGQVAQDTFDVGSASEQDVKALVAGLMAQSAQTGD